MMCYIIIEERQGFDDFQTQCSQDGRHGWLDNKSKVYEVISMETMFKIPNGEEKITVELTVKEALALAGARFLEPSVVLDARKKVKTTIEEKVLSQQQNIT